MLINGSPSKEFRMERGLRQGDPLSIFHFLLIAEALEIATLEACNKGIFKGVSLVNGGSNLSLLQYADDALFFDDWIGIPPNVVEEVVVSLGCTHDVFPFLYLGLPCLMVVMSHFGMILGVEMGFVSKIYSQDYSLSKFARIVKSLIDGSLLMVFGRAFGTGDAASSPVPIQMSFRTFIWQILILEFIINGIHEYLERKVWSWWHLPHPLSVPSFSILDIALGNIDTYGCSKLKKIINGVFQVSIWAIWKQRNNIIIAAPDDVDKVRSKDVSLLFRELPNRCPLYFEACFLELLDILAF
ncbi:hypothetical protein Tco_0910218 [Tanacetum coccineum]|uniref:Reverse transcriptase domain-containing protein n=1 Tax=Tanacetum coccineum TaxID=301880 RepID=A0ABQ5CUJ7_9ASTR